MSGKGARHAVPTASPMRRQGLGEQVYEALREIVFDRRAEPGSRINVDQLAAEMDVSQTPIREALTRLETEGLVVKIPMRGYFLTPVLDRDAFCDLYEMRIILEPPAAALASDNITKRDLEDLQESLRKLERAGVGASYREFAAHITADTLFHEVIAHASANSYLEEAIVRLHSHQHLFRLYTNNGMPDVAATLPEHSAILEALESGNSEAARSAMQRHLQRSQASMLALFEA